MTDPTETPAANEVGMPTPKQPEKHVNPKRELYSLVEQKIVSQGITEEPTKDRVEEAVVNALEQILHNDAYEHLHGEIYTQLIEVSEQFPSSMGRPIVVASAEKDLQSAEENMRLAAAHYLALSGKPSDIIVSTLLRTFREPRAKRTQEPGERAIIPGSEERLYAIDILSAVGPSAATPDILAILEEYQRKGNSRVCTTLTYLGEKGMDMILNSLQTGNDDVLLASMEGLEARQYLDKSFIIPESFPPALIGLLSSAEENIRHHAAFCLAALNSTDRIPEKDRVKEQLTELWNLKSRGGIVPERVAFHLMRLDKPYALALFRDSLAVPENEDLEVLFRSITNCDWFTNEDREVFTPLLKNENNAVRVRAAIVIASNNPQGTAAIPVLIDSLKSGLDEPLRNAFRGLGTSAYAAVKEVCQHHSDPIVRANAVEAMLITSEGDTDALVALKSALKDPGRGVQVAAADFYLRMPQKYRENPIVDQINALLAAIFKDPNQPTDLRVKSINVHMTSQIVEAKRLMQDVLLDEKESPAFQVQVKETIERLEVYEKESQNMSRGKN